MKKQNPIQKMNKTDISRLQKLYPILRKGLGSVIWAGCSLFIKASVDFNISTYVCPSDQESKTVIRVDFSAKKVADWEKSIIPFVNNLE